MRELSLIGEENKLLETLKLFAYGSYEDYMLNHQKFIELEENHKEKLRLLSLMSIAVKVISIY